MAALDVDNDTLVVKDDTYVVAPVQARRGPGVLFFAALAWIALIVLAGETPPEGATSA